MNATVFAVSLLTGLALSTPSSAQQVAASVVVRSGPVAGRVIVGNGYSTYRRPPVVAYRHPEARRVVIDQYAPRVIVVERVRGRGRGNYWARHGYRPVTLFYVDGRYYDRRVRGNSVGEIVVYERGGRYYEAGDRDHH